MYKWNVNNITLSTTLAYEGQIHVLFTTKVKVDDQRKLLYNGQVCGLLKML
jgi:hypothetical protein